MSTNNRVPYGLLTKEEKESFSTMDKQLGMYEVYHAKSGEWVLANASKFDDSHIYRLIETRSDDWILFRADCTYAPTGELRDLQYYHDHDRKWRRTDNIGYKWLYRYKKGEQK